MTNQYDFSFHALDIQIGLLEYRYTQEYCYENQNSISVFNLEIIIKTRQRIMIALRR